MIAVSNTSPICHLIRIQCIDIIPILLRNIFIPPQVFEELTHQDAPEEIRSFLSKPPPWMIVRQPQSIKPLHRIDPGEEAAINLAAELRADLLLIDDKSGRTIATMPPWNLAVVGTLGLLEKAAEENLLDLRTTLIRLMNTQFHLSAKLIHESIERHYKQ